ncbi:outer membrane lipoprotein, putative [unidentified eubacterium SCB49]|nr:outer membrane lipoprotein, putative [unidentified eubacterium SCB49]
MKKFFLSKIALVAISLLMVNCSEDDNDIIDVDDDAVVADYIVSGQITEDMTLTSDAIWTLDGRVTVVDGVTLTIEPGTIIKALPGQEASASVLIIARGANIEANGTASAPIIFTSSTDNIELGQTAGSNLSENDRGLWGGVIVLGYANASLSGDATENQIEGIPASDTNGLYGGSNDADNSGTLNYVSIRHGGTLIGDGNEINGLTLGGVGSGTTISNIEVVANVDDGIEWFGGSVDGSNLLVWAQGDDGLDIDEAFSGTVVNSLVIAGDISDHALEIDGPAGSLEGSFVLDGLTLIGNTNTENGEYADFRDGAMGTVKNVYATGFKDSADVELDNNEVSQNFLDGKIIFENWVVNGADNTIFVEKTACLENCDDDNDDNDVDEDKIILDPSFTERAAAWTTTGTNGGANTSVFSWTFASAKGAF